MFQDPDLNDNHHAASSATTRPPGALPASGFVDKCTQCQDCVVVCPSGALALDSQAFPVLDLAKRCGHCGLCADICTPQAIQFTQRTKAGLKLVLAIEAATT